MDLKKKHASKKAWKIVSYNKWQTIFSIFILKLRDEKN
jgi:hypothetical protein